MISKHFTRLFARWQQHPQLLAIGFILVSTTAFSAMNTGIRYVSDELHATTIMMLRNALTLLLLLPWVLRAGLASLKTPRLKAHALRGLVGGTGMLGWTYALTVMPLTHATALSFTAPLFVTLFAILFLGEKGGLARWLALIAGFIGTLIILQPSASGFDQNTLLVLVTTMIWAATTLMIKSLSATEPPLRMLVYMNLFMLLLATPFGVTHWSMPSMGGWAVLVIIAAASMLMHFSMVRAYALVPVVTLMPLDFTRLITTALFAWLIFGETSHSHIWLGAAIIIASAAIMARRDVKSPPPDTSV
jgi:drug/metabolite transporter (DMT)-like permease